eukprot:3853625-Rhodomonas_salina.1
MDEDHVEQGRDEEEEEEEEDDEEDDEESGLKMMRADELKVPLCNFAAESSGKCDFAAHVHVTFLHAVCFASHPDRIDHCGCDCASHHSRLDATLCQEQTSRSKKAGS